MHIPVLLEEVLKFFTPHSGQIFIDATLGLGGHGEAVLQRIAPDGKLFAFEQDERNRVLAQENLKKYKSQLQIFPVNFSHFSECLRSQENSKADGILFDIGISSLHLDDPNRGFSFRHDGPLDMRMDVKNPVRAADILKNSSAEELIRIFRTYGEEPHAIRFANAIVARRTHKNFETTIDLADFIASISPKPKHFQGGHPATLVFQALRIAVNDELHVLEKTLPQTLEFLKPGARLAIISFHSLEDRIVKNFFRRYSMRRKNQKYPSGEQPEEQGGPLRVLTKKPIFPCAQEIAENPRARSARLRVAEKI